MDQEPRPPLPRFERQRVLIVEDNEEHAVLLRAVLETSFPDASIYVVGSIEGAQAHLMSQDRFGDHGERSLPALILLDLWLTDGHGFEMLEWLKGRFPVIPVLVLTASTDPEDRKRSLALGARAFRTKPDDFGEVIGVIQSLLDEWKDCIGA